MIFHAKKTAIFWVKNTPGDLSDRVKTTRICASEFFPGQSVSGVWKTLTNLANSCFCEREFRSNDSTFMKLPKKSLRKSSGEFRGWHENVSGTLVLFSYLFSQSNAKKITTNYKISHIAIAKDLVELTHDLDNYSVLKSQCNEIIRIHLNRIKFFCSPVNKNYKKIQNYVIMMKMNKLRKDKNDMVKVVSKN